MLTRFGRLSRRSQFSNVIYLPDRNDGIFTDLASATFVMTITPLSDDWPTSYCDYGLLRHHMPRPALEIRTQADNDGPLRVLGPDNLGLFFLFTADQMSGLWPGLHEVSLIATVRDQTEEVLRETVPVV